MVNLSRIIWLFVGAVGVYVVVTKTNLLGSAISYVQKKTAPPPPPMMPAPAMAPMPPAPPPTSTASKVPPAPPSPTPSVPQRSQTPQNLPPPTSIGTPSSPNINDIGQQPSIPQSVPGRGPTSTAPVPPAPQTPTPAPIKSKTSRNSNNLGTTTQSQSPNTVPSTAGTPSAPAPQLAQNQVVRSTPTQNKGFTNGCGRSEGRDVYISCRAGIGTRSNGVTTPESGNQTTPVNQIIGAANQNHFYAKYHFDIDPSATVVSGHPQDTEITGGYNGSNSSEKAIGVTIGVKPDGTPFAKTEDEPNHQFKDLCTPGQCGGVSKVPNLGTSYDIVWAADKDMMGAKYRGYVITNDGMEHLIANIMPGIDFTNQNTYIRGRSNQLGNTVPSGFVTGGQYMPGGLTGSVPNQQPETPPTAGTPAKSNLARSMNYVAIS